MKIKKGQIILKTYLDAGSQKNVLLYLSKLSKSTSRDQLAKRLSKLPVVLFNDVSEEKSKLIIRNLGRLGAAATFLPKAESPKRHSQNASPGPRAIDPKGNSNPPQGARAPVLSSSGRNPEKKRRPISTGLLVMLIVSALTSGLYFFYQHTGKRINPTTAQLSKRSDPGQSDQHSVNRANVQSIMTVAPQSMYSAYIKQYTVSPDKTIIGAFNELIELYGYLSGIPAEKNPYRAGPLRYNETEITLTLFKLDQRVSEIRIPRPLDLGDALMSMQKWLAVMDGGESLEIVPAVHDENWGRKVGSALADFHGLDPRLIIRGLLNLDTLWQEEGPDARILLSAVRGYAILMFGSGPDPMNYTDVFASRALALLALAKKLDPTLPVTREEAFVSMILGYTAHAGKLIESGDAEIFGPVDHALSAYIRQDIDGLKQHLTEDASLLELYLLARLCREMGLFKEAEKITLYLMKQFPNLYPAIVEIIYSANLGAAKFLTGVYPLDILARLENQVTPDTIEDLATWRKRMDVFAGRSSEGNVSFSRFEKLLANWEPLRGYGHAGVLIDETKVRQVFRTLYTGAVHLRFDILRNRWGVLERAANYVKSFASVDPGHPLAMSMQIEVEIDSGNRAAAEALCARVIRHPQASASLATKAHYHISDKLAQIKVTPAVVSKIDSRPLNLFNLGHIFYRLYHYDFSEKFYSLGLAQDPYRYLTYAYLARVQGNAEPMLAAMEKFSDSSMMLEEAGDYFVERADRHSREKAVVLYRRAAEMQPTNQDLSRKLARALRILKRYDEAIPVLQDWIDRNGGENLTTTIYRRDMARIYLEKDDPEMALNTLEKEMDSYQAGTMMTIAAAYAMRNEFSKAESMYRKALNRYPQVDHVLSGMAAFLWKQRRDEEAAALIARGRRIKGIYSRWYYADFFKIFSQAPKARIMAVISSLKSAGASSWEISSLALYFADRDRNDIAIEILRKSPVKKTMERLELAVTIYEVFRQWKGEEPARNYLTKAVTPQQHGLLAMILFKRGYFTFLIDLIENPNSFQPQYREFIWLLKTMAWIAENEEPAGLRHQIYAHYKSGSRDYYHEIGRYMLGHISQAELLTLLKTSKQRCEFSYYIGFAARAKGNFSEAANWYQICRETLLSNNGEFHWASKELYWWAHMGTHNRHRLVRDDIRAYRQKHTRLSFT